MMEWRTKRPDVTCDTQSQRPITGKTGPLPGPLAVRIVLWLLIFAVFPLSVTTARYSFNVEVLGCTPYSALPAERGMTLAERVLLRLEKAEHKEIDPWLRDDLRIAWITVLEASRGNPQPHVDATYRVLGKHPDLIWQAILDRRAALLGPELERVRAGKTTRTGTKKNSTTKKTSQTEPVNSSAVSGVGPASVPYDRTSSPKKPCASERNPQWKKAA